MIFRFDRFALDPARFELRQGDVPVAIEPQVLSLLLLLVSNPDRLVSKDEIIEKIWHNRFVSESAVAARIKAARRAIGDDGKDQRLIRTVHGRGFRFIGAVEFQRPLAARAAADERPVLPDGEGEGRPSIAVLPFRLNGAAGLNAVLADALADELIADLARMHWLFVTARGSSFRFRGQHVDCRQVGESLGVRYCLTGGLTFSGSTVTVSVELIDNGSGGVLWAETFSDAVERVLDLRQEIVPHVIAALEMQIPANEARLARLTPIGQWNAWSAYHVGLDHMFRFNRADNAIARQTFEHALAVDSEFARAYAGLSFTRFQNAFLNYLPDRDAEAEAARLLAEQALQRDRLDPFCQLNMGRSLWLSGDLHDSVEWLERATMLSPSYAHGVYSKAWVKTLLGEADDGESEARLALRLSPLDPLRYAMLATRGLSHILKGDYHGAALLAERAARSPGAHKHIAIIAALATHFDGQVDKAAQWVARAKRSDPEIRGADFLRSFPFPPSGIREVIERALADLNL